MTHTVQELTQLVTQCTLHKEVLVKRISTLSPTNQAKVKEVGLGTQETTPVAEQTTPEAAQVALQVAAQVVAQVAAQAAEQALLHAGINTQTVVQQSRVAASLNPSKTVCERVMHAVKLVQLEMTRHSAEKSHLATTRIPIAVILSTQAPGKSLANWMIFQKVAVLHAESLRKQRALVPPQHAQTQTVTAALGLSNTNRTDVKTLGLIKVKHWQRCAVNPAKILLPSHSGVLLVAALAATARRTSDIVISS